MKIKSSFIAIASLIFITACGGGGGGGMGDSSYGPTPAPVSYTHLRAHET